MSQEPNNIDRLVREKLDGLEMNPPSGVWNDISSVLKSNKKRGLIFWLSLSLIAGIGICFFSQEGSKKTLIAQKTNSQETTEHSYRSNSRNLEKNSRNINQSNSIDDSNSLNNSNIIEGNKSSRSAESSSPIPLEENTRLNDKINDKSSTYESINQSASKQTNSTHLYSEEKIQKRIIASTGNTIVKSLNSDEDNNKLTGTSSNKSTHFSKVNLINSLPTSPIQFFKTENKTSIVSSLEEDLLPRKTSFWKAFSIEGSIGVSTFKNQPSKSTDANFSKHLTHTASDQLSFDLRLGLNYHFTNHLSFQSGVHYNSSREKYVFGSPKTLTLIYMDTISYSVDTVTMDTTYLVNPVPYDTTVLANKSTTNKYKIFTLPFQFAWAQPITNRGILEIAIGGELSIYGRNSGAVIVDNSTLAVDAKNGYRTTGLLSVGGSLKYLHRFGEHHAAYIEPWLQLGVTNQSMSSLSYETIRRRYGVRVGYRIYF